MTNKWIQKIFDGSFVLLVNLSQWFAESPHIVFEVIRWVGLFVLIIPIWIWCVLIYMIFTSIYNVIPMPLFELTDEQRKWCDENNIGIFDFIVAVESHIRAPRMKDIDKIGVIRFRNEKQAMAFKLRWIE